MLDLSIMYDTNPDYPEINIIFVDNNLKKALKVYDDRGMDLITIGDY